MRTSCMRAVLSSCLALALLAGFSACAQSQKQIGRGPLVGRKAPAFQIQGIFNEAYSLDTFKGHILVMQFGSTW